MEDKQFKSRIEELPHVSLFTLLNFKRDKADFVAFSPDYKDPFETTAQTLITTVEALIAPKKLTGELKQLTQQLVEIFTRCRNMLNKIERYLEKAASDNLMLTMAPADFGIKAARNEVNLKNDEGVVLQLRTLQQKLADNLTLLATKGYTTAVQTELTTLIKDLDDTSVAQTMKKKEREKLVLDNMDKLNELWMLTADILKTGKTIYKETNPGKVKDYTYASLIKDVRLKRKQQEGDTKPDAA